jgi:hypothetical protein
MFSQVVHARHHVFQAVPRGVDSSRVKPALALQRRSGSGFRVFIERAMYSYLGWPQQATEATENKPVRAIFRMKKRDVILTFILTL